MIKCATSLAAIGCAELPVFRRPRVAIISTGDEIVQPGEAMRPGLVYDSNGRILADAEPEAVVHFVVDVNVVLHSR